jgi:group I intron endonuclease
MSTSSLCVDESDIINNLLDKHTKYYTLEESEGKGSIYLLISPIGKVYVGQTFNVRKRWQNYKKISSSVKHQRHLYNALKCYGSENFIFKIIDISSLTQLELTEKEEYYMDTVYDSRIRENGYNIRGAGNNGTVSEETKQKQSNRMKGNKHHQFGKKHSKEWNLNIKIGNMGKHTGVIKSQKTKTKISETLKLKYGKDLNLKEEKKIFWKTYFKQKKWKWLWTLTDPTGNKIYVKNLSRFCTDNNLLSRSMSCVAEGKMHNHRGWIATKEPLDDENNSLAVDVEEFPNYHK